jgi:hypothetical protein
MPSADMLRPELEHSGGVMNFIKRNSSYIMAGILAAALYTPFVQADYSMPQAMQAGNVTYITGGIGDEERNALQAVKNHYNLSVMSAGASGAFAGDTHIVIRDRAGNELVDTDAGPLFYANLPPGSYTVEATSEGQVRNNKVTIGSGKPAHLHLTWR